ncbi:MAG: Nif11-like leader peptide family natural product precursor [Thermosynechococcaceae cyanobacterium]
MSQSSLEQFQAAIASNSSLQERVRGLADSDDFLSAIVALGAENGYSFTADDAAAAMSNLGEELSTEQLEAVAGGQKSNTNTTVPQTCSGTWC